MRPLVVRFLQGLKLVPTRELLALQNRYGIVKGPIFREDPRKPSVKNKTKGGVLNVFVDFLGFNFENWFHVASAGMPTCTLKSCIHTLCQQTPSCFKYTRVLFFKRVSFVSEKR